MTTHLSGHAIGRAPNRVRSTIKSVATGESAPAASAAMPAGYVAQSREVVHAGQAHDLPPGVLLGTTLLRLRSWYVLDYLFEQPALEPSGGGLGWRRGFGHRDLPTVPRRRILRDPSSGTPLPPSSAPARLAVGFGPKEISPTPALTGDSPQDPRGPTWVPRPRRYPEVRRFVAMPFTPADILPLRGVVNGRGHRDYDATPKRLTHKDYVNVPRAVHPDEYLHLDVPRAARPGVEDDVGG